jgi:hypothetical protein
MNVTAKFIIEIVIARIESLIYFPNIFIPGKAFFQNPRNAYFANCTAVSLVIANAPSFNFQINTAKTPLIIFGIVNSSEFLWSGFINNFSISLINSL